MAKLKKSPSIPDRGTKSVRGRPRKIPLQIEATNSAGRGHKIDETQNPQSESDQPPLPPPDDETPPQTTSQTALQSGTPATSKASWADVVAAETESAKDKNENIKVRQNPNFTMQLDKLVANAGKIEFSDEEMHQASENWKYTLIGCVIGTEITWTNMDKFIRAKWKGMKPPTIVKRNGVFLFQFQTHEDLTKIYESYTYFVFDHPLLLKRYEKGMSIGREIFDLSTVWIRLPELKLELWQPTYLSRLVSAVGTPLMADQATVQKTRLEYARVLVQLHEPSKLQENIQYTTPDGDQIQKIEYEWNPIPCHKCNRWGHQAKECDPDHGSKMKAIRAKEQKRHLQEEIPQPESKPQAPKQQTVWQAKDKGKSKMMQAPTYTEDNTSKVFLNTGPSSSQQIIRRPETVEDTSPHLIPY